MVWAASIIVSTWLLLKLVYWWQVKEYRWDRWWNWVEYNRGLGEVFRLNLRWPVWTDRARNICLTAGMGYVVMAVAGGPVLAVLGMVAGLVVGSGWTQLLVKRAEEEDGRKAAEILARHGPKVVGITGSFGKSSSRQFLNQILSTKYRVASTQGNENTFLGIARRIIRDVDEKTEVLIVEMGAYKRGEIAKICELVKPQVGLVTGIGNQHVDLFGGRDNLKKAKFEMVEGLKPGGVAVFDDEDIGSRDLVKWAKKRGIKTEIYETKVGRVERDGFELGGVWVPLRGKHFVTNVMGAITVAEVMGMEWSEIKKVVAKLQQPEKSLVIQQTKMGVTVIDDSYSTNEQGFAAAVDYLRLWKGKKYVVSPGIIELGVETEAVHRRLREKSKGIDGMWMSQYGGIEKVVQAGDVVLIEGRIPSGVKKRILSL